MNRSVLCQPTAWRNRGAGCMKPCVPSEYPVVFLLTALAFRPETSEGGWLNIVDLGALIVATGTLLVY